METIQTPVQTERRIPMSYDEFLQRIDDSTHAEWVNGEAIIFMPPTTAHQDIIGFLYILLQHFLQAFNLGRVLQAPYEMRLSPERSAREPDVLVVTTKNLSRVSDKRLIGPADIAVEVISPESVDRDRTEKFYEYQQAGIREYWLIDPRPGFERADFWVLGEDGRYQPVPLEEGKIYRSTVLENFWFDTSWLWADPLPNAMFCFAVIADLRDVQAALRAAGIGWNVPNVGSGR